MAAFYQGIIDTGIKDANTNLLNEKIRVANIISLFVIFVAGIPFIIISIYLYPTLTWIPSVGLLFAVATIGINKLQLYNLARFILAIMLGIMAGMYHANLLKEGESVLLGVFLFHLSFSLFPFVIYSSKEKTTLYLTLAINLLLLFFFRHLNFYQTEELDSALFRDSWLNELTVVLGIVMCVFTVAVLTLLNERSENKTLIVLAELEEGKKVAEASEVALQENLIDLRKVQEVEKMRVWASEGMSGLSALVRKNQDSDFFYDELITFLVKYMDASQGVIYSVEKMLENNGTESIIIKPESAYAFLRKKHLKESFLPGEGLIGQAYLEKDIIFLTEVPENFVKITSGLGEAKPRCIVVIPLLKDEVVEGVIELASFTELKDFELDFLKAAGETIASSIFNFRITTNNKIMLQQAQQQAEELRAQEEEMRQNLEEMQATEEEMQRQKHEMELKDEEMKRLIAQMKANEKDAYASAQKKEGL